MVSSYDVEVSIMPVMLCSCGTQMEVNIGKFPFQDPSHPERVIGSAICRKCNAGTGFELKDNVIVYVSSRSSYGNISANLSEVVKSLFAEAEMCFRSGSPNASAAMCRASLEIALTEKGIEGRVLADKIGNAKDILDEIEISLAHGSRIITRNAIHRSDLVSLNDIPSMLSATVRILNKLAISKVVPSGQ